MKSSKEQLEERGYVTEAYVSGFSHFDNHGLIVLLQSDVSKERTVAAYLLSYFPNNATLIALCEALEKEKKLYSKIALSETLGEMGEMALPFLTPLLGKIGTNQHKKLPNKPFNKKSYPLPRDIVARTLIKMGKIALLSLEGVIEKGNRKQVLEAIDAVGFISFYHSEDRSLPVLMECLEKYKEDKLVKWKIIRALQAFKDEKVVSLLESIVRESSEEAFVWEAERSLRQLKMRLEI